MGTSGKIFEIRTRFCSNPRVPDPNVFWHSSPTSHVVELAVHSLISLHLVPSAVVPALDKS